jgi:hypothetical protein
MKSRFETEMGVDFATLDSDGRLALARVFANAAPAFIAESIELGRALADQSQALDTLLKGTQDGAKSIEICRRYANAVNKHTELFSARLKEQAVRLGQEARRAGLQPDSNVPTTKTRQ